MFVKDPAAVLEYVVDWAAGYLGGETISVSDWSVVPVEPGGLAPGAARIEGGRTIVSLSGGRPGCVYRVSNAVTFSDGGHDERMLVVRVEDR
jgi:hypothetical protein